MKGYIYALDTDNTTYLAEAMNNDEMFKKIEQIIGTTWIRPLILNNLETKFTYYMFVDETALLKKDEKVNPLASEIAGQKIHGSVAICMEKKNDVAPLNDAAVKIFAEVVKSAKERLAAENPVAERLHYSWYTHLMFPKEAIEKIEGVIMDHDFDSFKLLQEVLNALARTSGYKQFLPGSAWDPEYDRFITLDEKTFCLITEVEHECG